MRAHLSLLIFSVAGVMNVLSGLGNLSTGNYLVASINAFFVFVFWRWTLEAWKEIGNAKGG